MLEIRQSYHYYLLRLLVHAYATARGQLLPSETFNNNSVGDFTFCHCMFYDCFVKVQKTSSNSILKIGEPQIPWCMFSSASWDTEDAILPVHGAEESEPTDSERLVTLRPVKQERESTVTS